MIFGVGKKSQGQAPSMPAGQIAEGQMMDGALRSSPSDLSNNPVFNVSVDTFEQRVIMASMLAPVIVDFWAPWCGPCKQLGPILEKVVREAKGEILMAKVNLDENQQLAAMMRVQSVPTVYAFFQGQPVDGFQGALPESHIRDFTNRLIKLARSAKPEAVDIPETLKSAAAALTENDLAGAQALYAQILQQDPLNVAAYTGIVRVFIAADDIDQASAMVDNAPPEIAKNSNFNEARSALELARSVSGSLQDLTSAVQKNPADHQTRIDLAMALFKAGKRVEATDELLESIRTDREWNEQAARKALLKLFEAMGQTDSVTVEARKKLSSILFS